MFLFGSWIRDLSPRSLDDREMETKFAECTLSRRTHLRRLKVFLGYFPGYSADNIDTSRSLCHV